MVDLGFPEIQGVIERQARRHSTESRAFLAWVLESIHRLEESDADDCVCDGPDDKGIDGLFADHTAERVEVFQSKLYQNNNRTIGDAPLRAFHGSLQQCQDKEAVEALRDSTENAELKGRIDELDLPNLIDQGYEVVGVFVSNAEVDANGQEYLARTPSISALSKKEIENLYVSDERARPETGEFTFDVSRYGCINFTNPQGIDVIMAPVSATQLVQIPGIESGELFEPNLRQSLGKTKVNKEIAASIDETTEHPQFMLYHNGITMVCEEFILDAANDSISIRNAFVVNGCQSLTSLFAKRHQATDDLMLPVKIVKVGMDSELLDKITHHSNNQNAIKARDFKSNHSIQVRIQNEFAQQFHGLIFYEVKRGETADSTQILISNELAARLLLAFDLHQPYTAHQSYKLFDDLYTQIFARPEVTAVRIYTVYRIYQKIVSATDMIEHRAFANYVLGKFFLLHVVSEALRSSEWGKAFFEDPSDFVMREQGFEILDACIEKLLSDLITDLNAEFREREEKNDPIDFKRELKSASAVSSLSRSIVSTYEKLVGRGRILSFEDEWNAMSEELSATPAPKQEA